jgi:signal transduction histidine kinase/DNA-binding response OmpR family regulator
MDQALILVIDDSQELVKHLTERLLPAIGYRTLHAHDGRAGLALIQDQQPDLVLLDLNLPEMTGLDVLQRLAQETTQIPIVLMTDYGSEQSAIEAFRLGARDYLIKPFTTEEVDETIKRVLTEEQAAQEHVPQTGQLQRANVDLRIRLEERSRLLTAYRALMHASSVEEVMDQALGAAADLVEAEQIAIWLWDDERSQLQAYRQDLEHVVRLPELTLAPDHPLLRPVVTEGSVRREAAFSGAGIPLNGDRHARAILLAPLRDDEGILGALGAINTQAPRAFSEREEGLIQDLAGAAGLAMQTARRLTAAAQLEASGRDEARNLIQLTRTVTSSLDLEHVVRTAIAQVHASWNVEATSLWLVNEQRRAVRVLANMGTASDLMRSVEVPLGQGIVGHAAKTGQWIYTNDAGQHPLHFSEVDTRTGFLTRSLLCVPLIFRQRVIGALELVNKKDGPFDARDVERALTLGTAIAVALANAMLYRQAESRQQQLEATLEHNGNPVIITDKDKRVVLLNRLARTRFAAGTEAVGRLAADALRPIELVRLLTQPLMDNEARRTELTLADESVWLCTLAPIPDYGRILILQDITYLKRMNESKSDFVATVSHDLRAPLSSIIEFARMLSEVDNLTETQRSYVGHIAETSERMLDLVGNLLDLARINSRIDISRQACDMVRVVRDVVTDLQGHALQQGIKVRLDVQTEGTLVLGDVRQLRQAVSNLLENAIKYSPAGAEVSIEVSTPDSAVLVRVRDRGPGIPMSEIPFIFDRFYRAKGQRHVAGTGLGLALVRSIAEVHGGQVWVDSDPGQGSAFTLQLPAYELRGTGGLAPSANG